MAARKNQYSLNQIAKRAGVPRPSLSLIVNRRRDCPTELSFALEALTGIPKETWVFYPEKIAGELNRLQKQG